jgi:hypothetical protein
MATSYTLASYKVKPGCEDQFMRAWNDLASTFSSLPNPPYWGTLIRSRSDRTLFYSFGPWENEADVAAMRTNDKAAAAFRGIQDACEAMTPGDYDLVRHVRVREEPAG